MRYAHAVIGANYGDEGKGIIVDRLAAEIGADVVVRANGGAQAGHTVCANGHRHVFHHIGAGSFAGAVTFLSRFFVSNPALFEPEWKALRGLGVKARIIVDPESLVTTPWDMVANQLIEKSRGDRRHGSCGVGFNETIERSIDPGSRLRVVDFADRPSSRWAAITLVARDFAIDRLDALGIAEARKVIAEYDDEFMAAWLNSLDFFCSHVDVGSQTYALGRPRTAVIFEGAQGLALDQSNRVDFPHLTRSNTGLRNVLRMCFEEGIDALKAIYVTRAYLTRHGAGPLPNEDQLSFVPKADETNVDHPWQGKLRLAPLECAAVGSRIRRDLAANLSLKSADLAITHLDVDGPISWLEHGRRKYADTAANFIESAADGIARAIGFPWILQSTGPKREDVDLTPRRPL